MKISQFPNSTFPNYVFPNSKLLFLFALLPTIRCFAQQDKDGSLLVNHVNREYIIHLPKNYNKHTPLPLMLIFHGGGGNSKQMQRYMGMDRIADKEDFITVYPNGLNKQWNDGREFKEAISANDDVLFISQLLDTLTQNYAIDIKRIFATGISNGGFFSIFLSFKLSDRLLAVAPISATIPEKIYDQFYPANPISLLLMNGTGDPLVPFTGGEVGNKMTGSRGRCMSTDKTIERYLAVDGTNPEAVIEDIPDHDKYDGCTAVKYIYDKGKNNTRVCLIKIINGGHALAGGSQYLPRFMIGKVCKDFEGNEMIWEFFKDSQTR